MKLKYALQGMFVVLPFLSLDSYALSLSKEPSTTSQHVIDDTTREKAKLFISQQSTHLIDSPLISKEKVSQVKIKTYYVNIYNEQEEIIQSFSFEYPNSKKTLQINHTYNYHDLCLKNKDNIEYVDKQIQGLSTLDFRQTISDEPALTFQFNFAYLKNINIGDCDIQTPVMQSFGEQIPLPFVSTEYDYVIKNVDNSLSHIHYKVTLDSFKK